jgi:hypothetical protein
MWVFAGKQIRARDKEQVQEQLPEPKKKNQAKQ